MLVLPLTLAVTSAGIRGQDSLGSETPLVTMGVVLGYVRLRCGTLWPCVVMHALFNARTMAFALLAPELLLNS